MESGSEVTQLPEFVRLKVWVTWMTTGNDMIMSLQTYCQPKSQWKSKLASDPSLRSDPKLRDSHSLPVGESKILEVRSRAHHKMGWRLKIFKNFENKLQKKC